MWPFLETEMRRVYLEDTDSGESTEAMSQRRHEGEMWSLGIGEVTNSGPLQPESAGTGRKEAQRAD